MKKLLLLLIILLGLTESKAQTKVLNSNRVDQVCDYCCSYAVTEMFLKSKGINNIDQAYLCNTLCQNNWDNCGTPSMEDISTDILGNSMFNNYDFITFVKKKNLVYWNSMKSSINNKKLSYLSIGYNNINNSKPFHVMAVKGYQTITKISKNYNFLLVNDPYCYSTLRMTKIRYDGVTDIKAEFPSEFLFEYYSNKSNVLPSAQSFPSNNNEINTDITIVDISKYDTSHVYVTYIKDTTLTTNYKYIVYDVKKKNVTTPVPMTRMQLENGVLTPLAIFEVKPIPQLTFKISDIIPASSTLSTERFINTKYYLSNVPVADVNPNQVIPYKKVTFPPSYNEYLYFEYDKKGYYYSLADLNEDIRFGKIYEKKYFLNKLWGFYKQFF